MVRIGTLMFSSVVLRAVLVGALLSAAPLALAAEPAAEQRPALTNEQLALAFGQLPALWSPRLSPDGGRVVMIVQPSKLDMPVAVVHEFESGTSKVVIASEPDEFDVTRCDWANDERLLCRFFGIGKMTGLTYGATRLVAVDADGSDMRVLMQAQMRRKLEGTGAIAQFQDRIRDWLPDDPKHVLIEEPSERGTGLSRLNVYTGRLSRVRRSRDHVRQWITDGSSNARLRLKWKEDERIWQHRKPDESKWETLSKTRPGEEGDEFQPIGFGDDPNRLFAYRRVDGRRALLSEDVVGEGGREVVFARDDVDLSGVEVLGPHGRIVAQGRDRDIDLPRRLPKGSPARHH